MSIDACLDRRLPQADGCLGKLLAIGFDATNAADNQQVILRRPYLWGQEQ